MNDNRVDIKSLTASKLVMRFESQDLALGTGFFYSHSSSHYLITNWHNVTGRDPDSLDPNSIHSGLPNNMVIGLNEEGKIGSRVEANIPLYEDDDHTQPRWFVHPEHKEETDVVAIPFEEPERVSIYHVNDERVSKTPNMKVQ